jgi:hypothetical protein
MYRRERGHYEYPEYNNALLVYPWANHRIIVIIAIAIIIIVVITIIINIVIAIIIDGQCPI